MRVKINNFVFPGVVLQFAGATAPTGYLICDGSSVSRATYASLFAAIGTIHGSASGTTFNLPDYRGRFLRGSDNMGSGAAARDPNADARTASNAGGATGATVGTVQADAMQGHRHNLPAQWTSTDGNAGLKGAGGAMADYSYFLGNSYPTDGSNGTPRISSESRPQNSNVNYIIKI